MNETKNHSVYGPSAANRWLECAASIKAESGLENKTSAFAEEGTRAHLLAENALKSGSDCKTFVDEKTFTSEMADYVQVYIDYVRAIGGKQEYEVKVDYSEYVPAGFGTADAICIVGDTLHVIDLKYGQGIKVSAYDNPQGKLYALGALLEREVFQEFKKVVIHIIQPRLDHITSWETTPQELHDFGAYAKERYYLTLDEHPDYNPGEKQCMFCLAKATCPGLATRTENALMTQFDAVSEKTLKPVTALTDEQIRFILNNKDLITGWLNSIEKHIVDKLLSGETFEGFKLVEGRSNRKWGDEVEAEKVLNKLLGKTNSYTKKLLSPAQAEKALGKDKKDKIEPLIIKPPGAPTLVSADDPREPIKPAITTNDF